MFSATDDTTTVIAYRTVGRDAPWDINKARQPGEVQDQGHIAKVVPGVAPGKANFLLQIVTALRVKYHEAMAWRGMIGAHNE